MNLQSRLQSKLGRVLIDLTSRVSDISRPSMGLDWTFNLFESNLFRGSLDYRFQKLQAKWDTSAPLWNAGDYHTAVRTRKEVLEDLYRTSLDLWDKHSPPLMENAWTSNIGHFGFLGVYSLAQQLGLVSGERKILLVCKESGNQQLEEHFSNLFTLISKHGQQNWSALSQFWLFCEKLQLIKTKNGFVDSFELWEQVFELNEQQPLPFMEIDSEYKDACLKELRRRGLNEGEFVTFHVRKESQGGDIRGASLMNYIEAMKLVIRSGLRILLIGDYTHEASQELAQMKELIDLRNTRFKPLHAFALMECLFAVGTASGPSTIPTLFGRPMLITNLTSIGRSMLRINKGSLFIPKRIFLKGRELTLSEVLSSRFGYMEGNPRELYREGVEFVENNKGQIRDSTLEMINVVRTSSCERNQENYNKGVRLIQEQTEAITKGNISEEFIASISPSYLT